MESRKSTPVRCSSFVRQASLCNRPPQRHRKGQNTWPGIENEETIVLLLLQIGSQCFWMKPSKKICWLIGFWFFLLEIGEFVEREINGNPEQVRLEREAIADGTRSKLLEGSQAERSKILFQRWPNVRKLWTAAVLHDSTSPPCGHKGTKVLEDAFFLFDQSPKR